MEGDSYLALENVDGGSAVGVMLFHSGGVLHGDEDNSEVMLFEESFGGVAGLPGFVLLGVGYLLEQVEMRKFVDHGAVSPRGCHVRTLLRCQEVYALLEGRIKEPEVGMDAVAYVSYTCGSLRALMRKAREAVSGADQ